MNTRPRIHQPSRDDQHALQRNGFIRILRRPLIDIRWWTHRDFLVKFTIGRRSITLWIT